MPKEGENTVHEPVKTLLSWKALSRPYKPRKREFYLMVLFVTVCFLVILFLFKEWVLMLAVLSITFLSLVLATTKPHEVEHRITTQGVITGEHTYLFKELYDFWFDEKDGHTVLYLRTYALFPGVLSLIVEEVGKEKVRDTLVKYIPYREVVKKTFMDKASSWLTKNFPLESKG